MSKILIVHAHHEPQSFSTSLARRAAETLTAQGHEVAFSDLHEMGFQPVSDRRNFTTAAEPGYLKQQREEAYATDHDGFAPEIEAEIRKLEACDLLIFSFPLWWFSMPAMLKGWVDRVLAFKRIYSRGQWYEDGIGRGKRAMVLMTTGGEAAKYGPGGFHGPLDTLLMPIHKGTFWFNGFSPLPPFVAWSAAHVSDEDRRHLLQYLDARLATIFEEPVIEMAKVADFDPATSIDTVPRFMVTVRRTRLPNDEDKALIPAEIARLKDLHRQGRLLSAQISPAGASLEEWRGFLLFRERNAVTVRLLCEALPLASGLSFEIAPVQASLEI